MRWSGCTLDRGGAESAATQPRALPPPPSDGLGGQLGGRQRVGFGWESVCLGSREGLPAHFRQRLRGAVLLVANQVLEVALGR
jgi:hypothetical protein